MLASLLVLVYMMSKVMPKVGVRGLVALYWDELGLVQSSSGIHGLSATPPVLPQKSPVYFLLVGGWSFSLYLLQLIFKNLREICKSYWQYLLGRWELWDSPGEKSPNGAATCWGAMLRLPGGGVRFPLILRAPSNFCAAPQVTCCSWAS